MLNSIKEKIKVGKCWKLEVCSCVCYVKGGCVVGENIWKMNVFR